jgi:hypothetical protein
MEGHSEERTLVLEKKVQAFLAKSDGTEHIDEHLVRFTIGGDSG